jgi:hypothetical protein
MMRTKMFGQAETTDYSTLTEAACALVPACVAWKAAGGEGALSTATGEVATQVKEAIGSGMAPAIVQLQRLESTITWAAVGTIVALVLASGAVVYVAVTRKR